MGTPKFRPLGGGESLSPPNVWGPRKDPQNRLPPPKIWGSDPQIWGSFWGSDPQIWGGKTIFPPQNLRPWGGNVFSPPKFWGSGGGMFLRAPQIWGPLMPTMVTPSSKSGRPLIFQQTAALGPQ